MTPSGSSAIPQIGQPELRTSRNLGVHGAGVHHAVVTCGDQVVLAGRDVFGDGVVAATVRVLVFSLMIHRFLLMAGG
jgi:hypothetical protein